MSQNKDEYLPPGIAGPRRSTEEASNNSNNPTTRYSRNYQEPMETAAANAAATRMAEEMGLSTSTGGPSVRRDSMSSSSRFSTNNKKRGFSNPFARNNNNEGSQRSDRSSLYDGSQRSNRILSSSPAAQPPQSVYQAVPPSGMTTGVGLLAPSVNKNKNDRLYDSDYVEDGVKYTRTNDDPDDDQTVRTSEPGLFDSTGMRAPYRQGPYDFHHDEDGRLVKKRWYGQVQDGYLAYSSIYLHEYLGFTIYMPLTEEEEDKMKKSEFLPNWMYEFTSLPNLAIPVSYFFIGIGLQLLRTPLIVYFIVDQDASAAQVNVLFTVMAVPWCFKMIYGFLSDCVPIGGLRRKPYFLFGWLIFILSNFFLMIPAAPSIGFCITMVFVQTAGYMLADVMTDALIVERSRFETQEQRGTMQSKGYIVRFAGSTIGAILGALVYNRDAGWDFYLPIRMIFFLNGALPMIFLLPVVPYLLELDTHCAPKNFWNQCKELFETVQLRAVWQPMTFVYIYNALQLTNAAWMNFLVQGLEFTAIEIGIVGIMGSITAWLGIMTYKKFFFASNWRIVYFWCTALASIIAMGQLILVFGWHRKLGIPDIVFSAGDDVLVEFVVAVQFLPLCIMYLGLCPPGSEGTTYAMLTTWSNLAGSLAFDISTALTDIWDVSSQTISEGDYSGVWKLSLLCGLIGPVPLLLLSLIPKNKEDQRQLQLDKTKHYWAGVIFLLVMIATLGITFVESIYEVYFNKDGAETEEENKRRLLKRLIGGH